MPGFVTVDDEIVKAWDGAPQGAVNLISSVGNEFKYHNFMDGVYQYTVNHSLTRNTVYFNITDPDVAFRFYYTTGTIPGGSTSAGNSITINESAHGSVVASSSSAAAGETITLTATPDDGYQLKSISGVYEAQATSSETLNATSATVNGNKFQAQATARNLYGWRVYNPGTANTLTVSSKDGATLIEKIEFTSTYGNSRANNMLSVSEGTLSFDGSDPSTTVTINDINATSVTISGSGENAAQTWCISSVKVYYTATIENELEISDTENANVKTFTMVDSEVTISAEFEPVPAPAPSVTAARFVYNYDCQRNPPYPQAGSPCNLSGFSDPLVGYTGIGIRNKALGPWKLEFVGYYTPSNHYDCEYRVISAVNSYYPTLSDEEKEAKCLEVPIFRLWQYNLAAKEYQHASYGIICAYAAEANAQDHGALFISSESWGCFLTGHQHTGSFQISCENDLTTGMADLVAAASINDPDLDAVLPVIVSIDAIGDVELTQFCKDQIEGSRAAYDALTDEQKAQVTNYSTLTDAEAAWADLVAAEQPYADAVIDLINAIPNPVVYTQDCKDKIDAAQAAYDALTDGQKILVSNYETLKNAPSDLINAAPYVHILFKANGNEKKVENVTLPREFTEAEMSTTLKELYGVEGDYDMYAYSNSNADAVNIIPYEKWTISPFMGEVNVNGGLYKYDPETGFDQIDFSLEISLELPPFGSAPTSTPNSIVINGTPAVGDNSISLTYYFDPANVPGITGYAPTLKVKCVEDGKFDEMWLSLSEISSGTTTITLDELGSFQAGKSYEVCFAYYNGSWVDEMFQSFTPAASTPTPTDEQVPTNADPENPSYHYSTFFHSTQNYALTNDGTTAFVADLSGNDLVLTEIAKGSQVIPMNTAVILRKSGSADLVVLTPTEEEGVYVNPDKNSLEGVDAQTAVTDITGLTRANCYVLSGQQGVGFYLINSDYLKAHKAYVKYVSNPSGAPKKMRFVFNTTTGVEAVTGYGLPVTEKRIENGQLVIIKNGVRYNAQGQIVK